VVTVQVDEEGEQYGILGVLVPAGWTADDVAYEGPFSGEMEFYEPVPEFEYSLESPYPSSPWDHWLHFLSDTTHYAEVGDTYTVALTIHTDGLVGVVDVAFLGCCGYTEEFYWNGDPCSTTVEVIEVGLASSTWGAVKREVGSR
jgi:hypothetical protein